PSEPLQFAELEFALAVLDERDLRDRAAHRARERFEGHAAVEAQLPDAASDGEGVEHVFIVERLVGCAAHVSMVTGAVLLLKRKMQEFRLASVEKSGCVGRTIE